MITHSDAEDTFHRTRRALPQTVELAWDVHYERRGVSEWGAAVHLVNAYDPFADEAPVPLAEEAGIDLPVSGDAYRVHICGSRDFVWFGDPEESATPVRLARQLVASLLDMLPVCSTPPTGSGPSETPKSSRA